MIKAVIDAIEDGSASIIAEQEGKEWTVDVDRLPDGLTEGDWIKMETREGRIMKLIPDPGETRDREQRIQKKLDQLKNNQDSQFEL